MRQYNAGKWGVDLRFLIGVDGSVIPRASIPGAGCAALTLILHSYCYGVLDVTDSVLDMWSGYTFVLGFLIVFRNNHAYSRFWDGSGLIMRTRGEWFNVVSSLFAFCATAPDKAVPVKEFQVKIVRLISMLFFAALQEVADIDVGDFEVIDMTGMEDVGCAFLSNRPEKSEVLMQWLQRAIVDGHNSGVLHIPPPILSRSFQELSRGMVNLVDVKKIKEIPFPFPYAQVATIMLLVYSLMTATFTSQHIESRVWACLLSYVVSTAFWALNYIAMELEQPFGVDPNDLPLKDIHIAMNESLLVLLHPVMQSCPEIEAAATKSIVSSDWVPASALRAQTFPRLPVPQVTLAERLANCLGCFSHSGDRQMPRSSRGSFRGLTDPFAPTFSARVEEALRTSSTTDLDKPTHSSAPNAPLVSPGGPEKKNGCKTAADLTPETFLTLPARDTGFPDHRPSCRGGLLPEPPIEVHNKGNDGATHVMAEPSVAQLEADCEALNAASKTTSRTLCTMLTAANGSAGTRPSEVKAGCACDSFVPNGSGAYGIAAVDAPKVPPPDEELGGRAGGTGPAWHRHSSPSRLDHLAAPRGSADSRPPEVKAGPARDGLFPKGNGAHSAAAAAAPGVLPPGAELGSPRAVQITAAPSLPEAHIANGDRAPGRYASRSGRAWNRQSFPGRPDNTLVLL